MTEMEAPTSDMKLFTREEVKSRNKRHDCLLIIHNSVYDVTKFLEEHPGGEEILLEQGGGDGTEPFEDVSHSSDARQLMAKYKIGEIVESERRGPTDPFPKKWQNGEGTEEKNPEWSTWSLAIAAGVFASLLYYYLFAQ